LICAGNDSIASRRAHFDHTAAAESAIADALAVRDEAGDARHGLGSADRLHVLVEDLIDRRHSLGLRENVVGILDRRTVDDVERHGRYWSIAAAMAGPAGDDLPSVEVVAVDRGHHLHHPARRPFPWRVERPVDVVRAGGRMAADAVRTDRRRHDPHRQHEVVDADALQRLDVLEHVLDHARFRGCGRPTLCGHESSRTGCRQEHDCGQRDDGFGR
jgi:hypothetical protein